MDKTHLGFYVNFLNAFYTRIFTVVVKKITVQIQLAKPIY